MSKRKVDRTGFMTTFCKKPGMKQMSTWKYMHQGECLAKSEQLFHKYRMMEALVRVSTCCHEAIMFDDRIVSGNRGSYFIQMGKGKRWYWELRSGNHRVVAISPKSYKNKEEALDAAKLFQKKLG